MKYNELHRRLGMRTALLSFGVTTARAAALAAAAAVSLAAESTVYLNGPADLDRLRSENPIHYARAQQVFAEANHFCRPGPARTQPVVTGVKNIACAGNLLRTSNPPKWQVSFTVDDTRYVALVTVTDDPPRLIRAR